jgi:hypothetical protein
MQALYILFNLWRVLLNVAQEIDDIRLANARHPDKTQRFSASGQAND